MGHRWTICRLDHPPVASGTAVRSDGGWSGSTRRARSWADPPATAVKYIRRIEEMIEAPVHLLSTSPERDDAIMVHNPFLG